MSYIASLDNSVRQQLLNSQSIEVRSPRVSLPDSSAVSLPSLMPKSEPNVLLDPSTQSVAIEQSQLVNFKSSVGNLQQMVQEQLEAMPEVTALVLKKVSGTISADEFDIMLTELLGKLKKQQTALSIAKIEQITSQNRQQMDLNVEKINEVAQQQKEAKKAGIFAKVFGWIASIVSVVVGVVMMATGVGFAAGALMLAGGVVGIVNMALEQAAQDGLISPEVMKVLGPVLMAVQIVLALASFGGAKLASLGASLGAKIGGKVAQVTANVAEKLASSAGKMAVMTTAMKVTKTASMVASTVSGAAATASQVGSSIMQGKALQKETEMAAIRLTLEQGQQFLELLSQELQRIQKNNEDLFALLMDMLGKNNKSCFDISRTNVIAS